MLTADSVGMLGAISHGLGGLTTGLERFDRAAVAIARDVGSEALATNLVELRRARQDVRANLAVLRTADEVTGTILDVFA